MSIVKSLERKDCQLWEVEWGSNGGEEEEEEGKRERKDLSISNLLL